VPGDKASYKSQVVQGKSIKVGRVPRLGQVELAKVGNLQVPRVKASCKCRPEQGELAKVGNLQVPRVKASCKCRPRQVGQGRQLTSDQFVSAGKGKVKFVKVGESQGRQAKVGKLQVPSIRASCKC
jgi:hypothetical protein